MSHPLNQIRDQFTNLDAFATARVSLGASFGPGSTRFAPGAGCAVSAFGDDPSRGGSARVLNGDRTMEKVATDVVRTQYRTLSDDEKTAVANVKAAGANMLGALDTFGKAGRETALARTKAEEAVMWAVKGITG